MLTQDLHADHTDTSGAYAKRYEIIKELVETGVLTTIPDEFKIQAPVSQPGQQVPVQTTNSKFNFYDENGKQHADHIDDTGEYREEWERQFGPIQNVAPVETPQQAEWKTFLQQLIQEERQKLNI